MPEDAAPARKSPPRLRVVFVDHCAQMSGGEIALLRLLRATASRIDPHVILAEHGPLVAELEAMHVSHEVMELDPQVAEVRKDSLGVSGILRPSNLETLRYVLRLRRRIVDLDPDVVHTNSLKAAVYGGLAGKLARRPTVWHIRDRIARDYLPLAAVVSLHWLGRFLPDAVVCNSHATQQTIRRARHSTVIFNPITHEGPVQGAASERRSGSFSVGVLGRLAPWKGQHVFLRAFAQAFRGKDARALIIGDSLFGEHDYRAQLRELTHELGIEDQVTFTGFQSDVWSKLAELDLLVHCSITPEPFGQVVLEGMVAGVPIIASNEGGPAEIITDGVDGILVPPNDPQGLAAAMTELHGDPKRRKQLAVAGLRTVRRFSPESTAESLTNLYLTVVRRRRRSRRPGAVMASTDAPSS